MDPDEAEFMENVFDALCSALVEPSNKSLFLAAEGPDLMVLMMKFVPSLQSPHENLIVDILLERNFSREVARSKRWTIQCQVSGVVRLVQHS